MTKTFTVKNGFDFDGFIAGCRTAGVKLAAETPGEEVDGWAELTVTVLDVDLTIADEAKMAIVTDQVAIFNV